MAEQDLLQQYVAKAQQTYEAGIKIIQDMTGWQKVETSQENVVCFRRPNADTSFDTFKADLYYNKPPRAVARYCYENWHTLNAELQSEDVEIFELVKKFNDDVQLAHTVTPAKGPVDGREFYAVGIFLDLGSDTYAFVANSVDSDLPTTPNKVKAELVLAVHLFEPAAGDATRTHHQSAILFDPKGSIPASLINSVLGNRAVFYDKLYAKIHAEVN